jgi:hypothetical protein
MPAPKACLRRAAVVRPRHDSLAAVWFPRPGYGELPNRPAGGVYRRRARMAETYTGEAYCVKCKEKRDFTGEVRVSQSGRRMAQGTCPVCGTKLNRILGKA